MTEESNAGAVALTLPLYAHFITLVGIDKQVVNVIAESSVIYGPDRDLENELDLDPDPDLVKLFDLDPEFTSMNLDKLSMGDDDKTLKGSIDQPPTSNDSSGSSAKEGRRARMKSKIKSKMQGPTPVNSHQQPSPQPQPHRPSPTALSRLEAMVVRYIKWLHILIQCRQLLCRDPTAATTAISVSFSQDQLSVATTASGILAGVVVQAAAIKSDSPTISITESTAAPGTLDRRPSDFLGTGNISTGNLGGASTPTKAPATTATTTSTTAMAVGPDPGGLGAKLAVAGGLLPVGSSLTSSPSTQANSTVSSASSSTSSLSSMSSSSAAAQAQAMLSQPATGTASGRVIGSRTLLTATAALEAAAHTNQQQQQQHNLASAGGSHPFMNEMNEMFSTHLDPLSNSVSEVIRKSSAKIKKSVVDPLAANPLFKSVTNASSSLTVSLSGSSGERASGGGGGRGSSAVSSAASSMRSVKSRSSAVLPVGMERTVSAASSASISAASVVAGGDDTDVAKAEDTETEKEAAAAAVVETVSILDPSHPAHQSDEQVIKILETLGLKSVAASEVSIKQGPASSRAASIISSQ